MTIANIVVLQDYPQLKLIAWHCQGCDAIVEEEAFALYERNWRYIDEATLKPHERQLITELSNKFGHGVMNV
ncbi:hypothetical protein ACF3NA_07435 [Alkanindiges sp. WGS2144]|uniref:hypothetical protein n=1 Tax=Alkanindiges sp. WGS2144 TaxID=3366808 RepID=UPI0037528EBE